VNLHAWLTVWLSVLTGSHGVTAWLFARMRRRITRLEQKK
jgi:hypothetical protein